MCGSHGMAMASLRVASIYNGERETHLFREAHDRDPTRWLTPADLWCARRKPAGPSTALRVEVLPNHKHSIG